MIRNVMVGLVVAGLLAGLTGCAEQGKAPAAKTDKGVKAPADKTTVAPKTTEAPKAVVTPKAVQTPKAVETPKAAPTPAVAPVAGKDEGPGKLVANKMLVVAVPAAAKAVTIDGKLADPAWKDAPALNGFITEAKKPAGQDARVLVSYDKDNLYVAVINTEPNTDKLKATVTQTDGPVWEDDSNEIYLDAKDGDFYGFFVNSKNARYDRQKSEQWSGKGKWTSAAQVNPKKDWVVEVAIPFKTLGVTPKAGTKLGLMVARNHMAGGKGDTYYLADCKGEAKDTSRYVELELK